MLREPPASLDELRGLFSESQHPAQWPHVAHALTYRRAIPELAEVLGIEPTEDALLAHRQATDPLAYAAALLGPTNSDWLLLDDGFPPAAEGLTLEEMGRAAGARTAPVMRIERVAEEALDAGLDALREHVRAAVRGARAGGYAGLKTIAAYRGGLDLGDADPAAARDALAARPAGSRLEGGPLLDLVVHDALEANAADPLPVQVHAGFGDADLFLPRADPALLAPLVERHPRTPFVLLHCYPYVRQAGWLAHVYANVFLDVSLTIPHSARPVEALREALELAPASKLLYASDAARAPELYLLAARRFRAALAEVLGEAQIDAAAAEELGRRILRENALALYALGST